MRKFVACANALQMPVLLGEFLLNCSTEWSAGRLRPATTLLDGRDAPSRSIFFSITRAAVYNTPIRVYSCSP